MKSHIHKMNVCPPMDKITNPQFKESKNGSTIDFKCKCGKGQLTISAPSQIVGNQGADNFFTYMMVKSYEQDSRFIVGSLSEYMSFHAHNKTSGCQPSDYNSLRRLHTKAKKYMDYMSQARFTYTIKGKSMDYVSVPLVVIHGIRGDKIFLEIHENAYNFLKAHGWVDVIDLRYLGLSPKEQLLYRYVIRLINTNKSFNEIKYIEIGKAIEACDLPKYEEVINNRNSPEKRIYIPLEKIIDEINKSKLLNLAICDKDKKKLSKTARNKHEESKSDKYFYGYYLSYTLKMHAE